MRLPIASDVRRVKSKIGLRQSCATIGNNLGAGGVYGPS